jgi:short subunit dehydrogenase-like uncharacterized protein
MRMAQLAARRREVNPGRCACRRALAMVCARRGVPQSAAMSGQAMIYGASGYSGRLILERALQLGMAPILCGRDAGKLARLASRHGLSHRVASLLDAEALHAALRDVDVVLNAAGPFSATAGPLVAACLRAGVHYLDISGELAVIERLSQQHAAARRRGVMVLPGTGFDVVASDCLAAHVAARVRRPTRLAIAIRGLELASRGSVLSFLEQAGRPVWVRRDGALTGIAPGTLERDFDFGDGPSPCVNVTWGDVTSSYFSTGIPNIDVYFESGPLLRGALVASRFASAWAGLAPWQVWARMHAALVPEGPSQAERDAARVILVVEVEDAQGERARARLHTAQSYSLTALAAAAILRRVLDGDAEAGFQTPSRLYGAEFVLSLDGVSRQDSI